MKKPYVRNMLGASEKIIMAEVSGYVSELVNAMNVLHNENSILYTATNIYHKAGILMKVSNVFRSENLALFTVTSIYSIWKSTKTETSKQDGRQQKIQGSNRSKDRAIQLINKEIWRKRKGIQYKKLIDT